MAEQPTFLICPYCQGYSDLTKLRAAGHLSKQHDYSICNKCGEVSIFNEDLSIRKMEFEDWMDMQKKGNIFDKIDLAQKQIKYRIKTNPPPPDETSRTPSPL